MTSLTHTLSSLSEKATQGEWRPAGFGWGDLYEVSSSGNVRRIGSAQFLGVISPNGYRRVQFSRKRKTQTYLVHKLVAQAFIGERPSPEHHIDHINGKRDDNRVDNLRYCTPKENIGFSKERGALAVGEKNGVSVLTDDQVLMIRAAKAFGGRFWGAAQISEEIGVGESTVRQAATRFRYGHLPSVEHIASAIRSLIPDSVNEIHSSDGVKEERPTDPIERMVFDALTDAGVSFTQNDANLDFRLPTFGVYIECKQFHSPRIAEQSSRVENLIVVQGRNAASFLTHLIRGAR